jgi:Reverse transcriptase (RNA-dependent DNA polymerase)
MQTRTKTKSLKPKEFPHHQLYVASNKPIEPTCYTQAIKDPSWRQAMATELTALAHNATWDLVPCPPGAHVIGAKWVFKVKLRSDGTVERCKARLVAKGYDQQEGVDYLETFSPVVRPGTIRIILSIALSQKWAVHQLDVNNAFLHGDISETIYMEQPPGFSNPSLPSHVCKLKKALYGLKQAPRAWFSKLKGFLLTQGFKSSQADHSLFFKVNSHSTTYILVYVDDILVTGSSSHAIQSLLSALQQQFSLKNLGCLNYFLGIEVTDENGSLHLSQTRYLQSLLERTHMHNAKPIHTPMVSGQQLSKFSGTKLLDPHLYRSTVGALQYATVTRPDLTFAVNKASQFMCEPTDHHWHMVKRILRYIKGTIHHGLSFQPASQLALHAYSDADWAGCPDDRRSTTGFAVYFGPNLISWSSKKQPTVSRSSTEAEYRSMTVTASELTWISSLLQELQFPMTQAPTLWCDNLGATFLASNPVYHARTKHIELDYHFVREKIENKQLQVKFICSADQIGDFFTKALGRTRFQLLRTKLHVFPK